MHYKIFILIPKLAIQSCFLKEKTYGSFSEITLTHLRMLNYSTVSKGLINNAGLK